jgi:hypothetical protein
MSAVAAPPELSIQELCDVMETAKVRQIMAADEVTRVVVDYFPARQAMVFLKEDGDDEPTELYPQKAIPLTFVLEDAMFGGHVFASITCGHKVIVLPFLWRGYEHVGAMQLIRSTK